MAERLATHPHFERVYEPDAGAMLAALRAVLGLTRPFEQAGGSAR